VTMHRKARSLPGEAHGLQSLAKLYTRRGELIAAKRSLDRAGELRSRSNSIGAWPNEGDAGLLHLLDLTTLYGREGTGYSTGEG
jgi:hypothetical protein